MNYDLCGLLNFGPLATTSRKVSSRRLRLRVSQSRRHECTFLQHVHKLMGSEDVQAATQRACWEARATRAERRPRVCNIAHCICSRRGAGFQGHGMCF